MPPERQVAVCRQGPRKAAGGSKAINGKRDFLHTELSTAGTMAIGHHTAAIVSDRRRAGTGTKQCRVTTGDQIMTWGWANRRGIRIEYIQPGNPQQNAHEERFNRTVRYEWLAQYLFDTVGEVQDFATQWLWNYNHERPNMALGGFTPKQRLAMAA